MTDVLLETPEYYGSLVAFEGPQDIISTQLRLLPSSSKLLVLPPVRSFFSKEKAGSSFDLRSHILETHEACDARTEIARAFLRGSTPDNKRLVFLNGGTASAHMSCIAAISKHETNGDTAAAEAIYNRLMQFGIAGLKRKPIPGNRTEVFPELDGTTGMDEQDDDILEDPITRAMRAADRLDRETAFLQDPLEVDLTISTRPRSMSVPAIPLTNDLENALPHYLRSPTNIDSKDPLPGAGEPYQHSQVEKGQSLTSTGDKSTNLTLKPRSPGYLGDANLTVPFTPSTPGSPYAQFESLPGSPIMLGEALIVDIRPARAARHKSIKSVDRIYATAIRNQDISLCNFTDSIMAKLEEPASTQSNMLRPGDKSSRNSILLSNLRRNFPYPTLEKPTRILRRKKSPPRLHLETNDPLLPESCAIQGVDPAKGDAHSLKPAITSPFIPARKPGNADSYLNLGDDFDVDTNEPFEAILPMMEDLVIHFKCDETEPKLEVMIQAFKDGTFPVSKASLLPQLKESNEQLDSFITGGSTLNIGDQDIPESHQPIEEPMSAQSPDDYDPFAYYLSNQPSSTIYTSKPDSYSQSQATLVVSTPPTPAQTPPPLPAPPADDVPSRKVFHEFDTRDCKTAVCIQNSLRSILNVYFAPEKLGYQQFNFPLLPELGSFWKPVFREITYGNPKTTRKIDLIFAIGAQKSSGKDLLNAVCSSLEKLGKEPNGKSRSGRLDLRYLIASAMQAFTSQPLTNQTQDNPFSNPFLLATLIIPHLETHIAAHATTRFIILEYPAEYLSTILALQHLIGVDLLKVAGIVDADGSESKSQRVYRQRIPHTRSHPAMASCIKGTGTPILQTKESRSTLGATENIPIPEPSFSKANFILTSTATEFEIATLISTIWRMLIDISPVYMPHNRNEFDFDSTSHYRLSPSSSSTHSEEQYAPFLKAASMLGFMPVPEQKPPQYPQWTRPNYASNETHADFPPHRPITPSSKLAALTGINPIPRTLHTQRNKLLQLLGRESEAGVNAAAIYGSFDDDNEEDDYGPLTAEERKYMPLWSNQGNPRKGNSRKALKWLGLSN